MIFGKYEVIRELGKGGMGVVYLAFDPALQREVAIKTISQNSVDQKAEDRFIREARAAARLRHPNILHIYDLGREENQLYMAMEYLEGRDLDEVIAANTPLTIPEKLEIVRQICEGLNYAHENGIFHRDVKPGNIKLLPDGTVKIMDFGLAVVQASTMTETGYAMGTPYYSAPEVIQGKRADSRSDQFAVGLLMYELLTYQPAFSAETVLAILYRIIHEEPRNFDPQFSELYPEIESIIQKSIQKNPEERFPTLKDMSSALKALREDLEMKGNCDSGPVPVIDAPMQPDPSRWRIPSPRTTPNTPPPHSEKPRRLKIWIFVLPASIILGLFLLFRLFFQSTPSQNNGFLLFDVKPYARLENVWDLKTGRSLQLPKDNRLTPLRLALNPGRYRIEYSHPEWKNEVRTRTIEITAGETVQELDFIRPQFPEKALQRFLVPQSIQSGDNQ